MREEFSRSFSFPTKALAYVNVKPPFPTPPPKQRNGRKKERESERIVQWNASRLSQLNPKILEK